MRHYLYSKYFLPLLIGVCLIVGLLVLWLNSPSAESGQDTEKSVEEVKKSLPSTAIADDGPLVTITPIVTVTQKPPSLVEEAMTPTGTAPIFVLAEQSLTTVEVWQFSPGDGQWSMLYSISSTTDKPENVTIPPEELERMQNYLAAQTPPMPVPDESFFKRYPGYLTLAPTIKQLAFVESYSFFADDTQTGHFGIRYTGNFALETGQSQIFFQVPIRVFVDEWYYITDLRMPLWSPNGEYFSVNYDVIEHTSTPLIINVNTGAVQQLESAANLFGPLAWSPDSKTVALYLYRSGFEASGGVIRLCGIASLNCQDIELDEVWIDPRGADWTQHRNQIVFTGANEDFRWSPSPPPFGLYLFDPETDAVHKLLDSFNRSLANPVWSPDGRFIAVEYNTEGVIASPNKIVIVEPDSEQVITELPIEGCDWQWEQSSQSIMQLPCGRPKSDSLMVFSVFDASSQQIELPFELSLKRRLGFNTLKRP